MQRANLTQLIERGGHTVARRMQKIRVTVLDGPARGATFEGAQDEIRVGSAEDNDLTVRDGSVSRRHVSLRVLSVGLRAIDLASTNGTFIGDVRVNDVILLDATEMFLGTTKILIEPLADSVEKDISTTVRFGRLVGTSVSMREVFAVLERVSRSELGVLIEGESGTGKAMVADAIHRHSARAGGALVTFDCTTIARERIEAELFGDGARPGAIAGAEGGTLYVCEVGELPLEAQSRLLRLLEARDTNPLHGPDVRVLASTQKNLAREAREGRFRQDLLYRLGAVSVRLPPLRARLEDVPILAETILEELNRRRASQGLTPYPALDRRAMDLLSRYEFPGNVRELRNLVERFAVLGTDPSALLPQQSQPDNRVGGYEIRTDLPFHDAKEIWTEIFEKTYLTRLLQTHGHNVSAAARTSGIDRRHLQRLMVKHELRERTGDE